MVLKDTGIEEKTVYTDDGWLKGKEDKTIHTFNAVPGTVHQLTKETVSLLKSMYLSKGKKLNGVVYEADMDGNNVNIFLCNSGNLHDIHKKSSWSGHSNYTRAQVGDTCFVLPTKKAGNGLPGYQFKLESKEDNG